jgi:hypothetical protein
MQENSGKNKIWDWLAAVSREMHIIGNLFRGDASVGDVPKIHVKHIAGTFGRGRTDEGRDGELVGRIRSLEGFGDDAKRRRYEELTKKRDEDALIPGSDEHCELIRLHEELEARHANRLRSLLELAKLRLTTLADVMKHPDVLVEAPTVEDQATYLRQAAPDLSVRDRETELVRQINSLKDFSGEFSRQRYDELIEKLEDGALEQDGDEHRELIRMTDDAEMRDAKRLELLLELAKLRSTTLLEVMDHPDVSVPAHA